MSLIIPTEGEVIGTELAKHQIEKRAAEAAEKARKDAEEAAARHAEAKKNGLL